MKKKRLESGIEEKYEARGGEGQRDGDCAK